MSLCVPCLLPGSTLGNDNILKLVLFFDTADTLTASHLQCVLSAPQRQTDVVPLSHVPGVCLCLLSGHIIPVTSPGMLILQATISTKRSRLCFNPSACRRPPSSASPTYTSEVQSSELVSSYLLKTVSSLGPDNRQPIPGSFSWPLPAQRPPPLPLRSSCVWMLSVGNNPWSLFCFTLCGLLSEKPAYTGKKSKLQ